MFCIVKAKQLQPAAICSKVYIEALLQIYSHYTRTECNIGPLTPRWLAMSCSLVTIDWNIRDLYQLLLWDILARGISSLCLGDLMFVIATIDTRNIPHHYWTLGLLMEAGLEATVSAQEGLISCYSMLSSWALIIRLLTQIHCWIDFEILVSPLRIVATSISILWQCVSCTGRVTVSCLALSWS